MVNDKERMIEWLERSATQINELRRKPRLSREKCLTTIQGNYQIITVLTMVLKGEAYMTGVIPPNNPIN